MVTSVLRYLGLPSPHFLWFEKPLKQSVLVSAIISCVTMTSEKSGFNNDGRPVEQLPWARNGFVHPLPEHQDQAGKRNKYKYKYKYKYREKECPGKELSSVYPEAAHQKHVIKKEKKEEYKNRLPLRERNEFSAPLLTTDHQDCRKGGKQKQKHCIFLTKFYDETYDYKSLIIYVWWWLCLIILKKVQNWCWAQTQS